MDERARSQAAAAVDSAAPEVDLRRYVAALRRQGRIVVLLTVLAALGGGVLVATSRPVYESEAMITLSEHSAPPYADAQTAALAITDPAFLESVARSRDLDLSGRRLQRQVQVETNREPPFLIVRVRDPEPQRAREVNQAIMEALVRAAVVVVEERREFLRQDLDALNAQLDEVTAITAMSRAVLSRLERGEITEADRGFVMSFALNAMRVSGALYGTLTARRADLNAQLLAVVSPQLVRSPSLPDRPIAPQSARTVLLAAALGLFAGIFAAFVLEYFRAPAAPARLGVASVPEEAGAARPGGAGV